MFFKFHPFFIILLITAPGIIANPVSGNPNIDDLVIILKSHAKANSKPPPSANPSITPITGCGKFAI